MFDHSGGRRRWTIGVARVEGDCAHTVTHRSPAEPTPPSSSACGPTSCGWPTATSAASARPRTRAGGVAAALRAPIDAEIRDLRAWLTTVVSRLALDALTSARARRERYVGPWLPEPVVRRRRRRRPGHRVDLDEYVSMAMLIVLESLSPGGAQRVPAPRRVRLLVLRGGAHRRSHARRPPASWRPRGRGRGRAPAPALSRPAPRSSARSSRRSSRRPRTGTSPPCSSSWILSVTFRSDGGGLVPAARKVFTGAERVAAHPHGDGRPLRRALHRLAASPSTAPGRADEDRRASPA